MVSSNRNNQEKDRNYENAYIKILETESVITEMKSSLIAYIQVGRRISDSVGIIQSTIENEKKKD